MSAIAEGMKVYLHLHLLILLGLLTAVGPNSAMAALRCEFVHQGLPAISAAPEPHFQNLLQALNGAQAEAQNPYSLAHDVFKVDINAVDYDRDIQNLQQILFQESGIKRKQDLNDWVRSEEHALFLYDKLSQTGLEKFKDELQYLHDNNVYMIDSHWSGNSFVTYSFEKEGTSADISLLFRPPQIADEEWLNKPEQERMKLLRKIHIPLKTFTSADLVAPTELKPEAVGGYSQEVGGTKNWLEYGWEISHKKYEINWQRLMRSVKDLAHIFKQTDSFHVHVVFELPKKYASYENFIYWYKQFNDYLYLKGLEEGLHGNYLTGVANLSADISWSEKIRGWLRLFYSKSNVVEENQDLLGKRNSKFFSAGLRAGIYGPASNDQSMKIGLELRDATRNMNLLSQFVEKLSHSLESRPWENSALPEIKKESLRLTSDRPTARDGISSVVSAEYAKLFSKIEPTVYFGLIRYEETNVYNYKNKSWVEISPEIRARLQEARAGYEHDLKALETELREKKAKGEQVEDEIVKLAIRMSLAGWAKHARAAELFENY